MVITLKCGNESTFFSNGETGLNIESEATDGMIELVNETKVEFINSDDVVVTSMDTSSQQVLIPNKSVSKIHLFEEDHTGDVIYATGNVINCICSRDCNGSDRTDVLPAASSLIDAIDNCQVGSSFHFILRNTGTNNVLTLAVSLGGITLTDIATVANDTVSHWLFTVTNVAAPAITGYLLDSTTLSSLVSYESTYSMSLSGNGGGNFYFQNYTGGALPFNRAGNGSGASDAWSISMWFKQVDPTPPGFMPIFVANILNIHINYETDHTLHFKYGNIGFFALYMRTTNTFTYNNWYHILWTYAGGPTGNDPAQLATYFGEFKVYIDGALQTTVDTPINNGYTGAMDIQSINMGILFGNDYTGKVDEIALFDADVSSDVSNIYNGGNTHNLSDLATPPVNWWKIEPAVDSFPIITDVVGGIDFDSVANLTLSNVNNDTPPPHTVSAFNSMSVKNGTLELTGLTNGFPLRRENNTGVGWTFGLYFRPNSTISSTNHNLLEAGLISLKYSGTNHNLMFTYGDAFNYLRKFTAHDSLVDDQWSYIAVTLDPGDLGVQSAQLTTYYDRIKLYLGKIESTSTETNANFGINPATNQFTSMTIGSDVGHIAYLSIDDNARGPIGINNLYNNGVVRNLSTLGNPPEYWWKFGNSDILPNATPSLGAGDLVMTSGTFDHTIYPAA